MKEIGARQRGEIDFGLLRVCVGKSIQLVEVSLGVNWAKTDWPQQMSQLPALFWPHQFNMLRQGVDAGQDQDHWPARFLHQCLEVIEHGTVRGTAGIGESMLCLVVMNADDAVSFGLLEDHFPDLKRGFRLSGGRIVKRFQCRTAQILQRVPRPQPELDKPSRPTVWHRCGAVIKRPDQVIDFMRLSHSRFSGNEKTPRFKCSAGHCFRIIVLKTTVELRPQLLRSWKRIPFVEARFFEPLNTIEVTRRFEEHLRKLREAKLSPEEREKEDWQRAADTVTRKDHARIRRRVDRLEQNRHRASGFSHLKADDRQQIEMLSSGVELRRITVSGRDGMTIGTVHALQGAERPVVIFSPVYSKHADGGFIDASPSMLNVTVSRAKDSFLVFGDMDVLATARSGSPRALLSEFLATKGKALDFAMEPREDLTRGEARIEMLQQAAEHDAFLLDALRGEGRRYVIVSPWVVAGTIERTGLLDAMATARQRGAEIEVFADPLLNTGPAAGGLSQIEAVKSRLSEIGVAMHRVPKLHSKIVTVDKDLLCAGSFNWLSADRNGQYARHETSFVYRGPHLEEEIKIIRAGLLHRAE